MTHIQELPFLGIRKRTVFPGTYVRLQIGRSRSTKLAFSLFDERNNSLKKNAFPYIFVATLIPDAKAASEEEFKSMDVSVDTLQLPFQDSEEDESNKFFKHGVIVKVLSLTQTQSKAMEPTFSMLVESIQRAEFKSFLSTSPFFIATVKPQPKFDAGSLPIEKLKKVKALSLSLRKSGAELVSLLKKKSSSKFKQISQDLLSRIEDLDIELLADVLTNLSDARLDEYLGLIAEADVERRLNKALELVNRQIEIYKLSEKIQSSVDDTVKNSQREFFLKQQQKAIQKELNQIAKERGEFVGTGEEKNEIEELSEKLEAKKLPEEAYKTAEKELQRLKSMQPSQPEYSVIKTYLDVVLDLPWNELTEDNLDVLNAQKILDEDHFGLDKVKKRVLEFLAVMSLNRLKDKGSAKKLNAPILCFYGPPGVGKTSLGKSIARALNRKFARFALGGVRDEAEIRGHRKTYIGALPGKIIQTYRKVKSNNPLILLDEIDKVSSFSGNRQGDVTAALLEVLDPEQNDSFNDHYLGIPYDLSKTLFIATANDLSTIPGPLLDRMEIIEIASYTAKEKFEIARKYLVPKQLAKHSLELDSVDFKPEALEKLISNYTREAGIRSLERQIAAICRHVAVKHLSSIQTASPMLVPMSSLESDSDSISTAATAGVPQKPQPTQDTFVITAKSVVEILGSEVYESEFELSPFVSDHSPSLKVPGVSLGLAYTKFGGDILFIEVVVHYGTGKIHLTGQLGKVMSESVNTALSYIKANVGKLGLKQQFAKFGVDIHSVFNKIDVHVHFPAGAVPKDGPSAGVAICAAIVSAVSGVAVRGDTACTGEISLRGAVLPVGGIKEKVLGAYRNGIKKVLLPLKNFRDCDEIPKDVLKEMEITPCKQISDALAQLFPNFEEVAQKLPRWLYDFPPDTDFQLPSLLESGEADFFPNSNSKQFKVSKRFDTVNPELRSSL